MISQLFVGFVSYVAGRMDAHNLEKFQDEIAALLEELQNSDDTAEISWYSELKDYWASQIDEDEIEEGEERFLEFINSLDEDQLIHLATDIRNEFMLESAPPLIYEIDSFYAVFFVKWKDGMQAEIRCNPVIEEEFKETFELSVEKIDEMMEAFQQQITEITLKPGFDSLHDQVSNPFPRDKFDELIGVLDDYINKQEATLRPDYDLVLKRFKHIFEQEKDDSIKDYPSDQIDWLNNGGGF